MFLFSKKNNSFLIEVVNEVNIFSSKVNGLVFIKSKL